MRYACTSAVEAGYTNVKIRLPGEGGLSTATYRGQEALNRMRQWILEMHPEVTDQDWLGAPAHGDPAGVLRWWERSGANGDSIYEIRLRDADRQLIPGEATSDKRAWAAIERLIATWWDELDYLSAADTAVKLLAAPSLDGEQYTKVIASGWSWSLAVTGPEKLHVLDARARPLGRQADDDDEDYISAVLKAIGAPPQRGCVELAPEERRWVWGAP